MKKGVQKGGNMMNDAIESIKNMFPSTTSSETTNNGVKEPENGTSEEIKPETSENGTSEEIKPETSENENKQDGGKKHKKKNKSTKKMKSKKPIKKPKTKKSGKKNRKSHKK